MSNPTRRLAAIPGVALLTAASCAIETMAGPDYAVGVVHVAPVMLAAWLLPRPGGWLAALTSGIVGYFAQVGDSHDLPAQVAAVNATMRTVVLAVQAEVLHRLREEMAIRQTLNRSLIAALAQVRTVSGLVPVCAWCRKLRNDDGYWQLLEAYLGQHTDATVTHGICPACERANAGVGEG